MRILSTLATLGSLAYGYYWVEHNHPSWKKKVLGMIDNGQFHTLELHYNADQIMEEYRNKLLKDKRHAFLKPEIKFYPYVLLEVKYNYTEDKTREGLLLWDLLDGEIVLDTTTWEKTHGFADCINANTQPHEFKILNLLARKGGSIDRDGLSHELHLDNDIVDAWIDSCRRKKLIVQSGNRYRIHLQNPRLKNIPETKINAPLVTKPHKDAQCVSRRYSIAQIHKIAKAAFGKDFAIRKTTDVYLPVHQIVVKNPDGSVQTSHWNALNGKCLSQAHYVH